MSTINVIPPENITKQLDLLNLKLDLRQTKEAEQILYSLENVSSLKDAKDKVSFEFLLLKYRLLVEIRDFSKADLVMNQLDSISKNFDNRLRFNFYFVKGMHQQDLHNIEEALRFYKLALDLSVQGDIPTLAEFNYRLAGTYYLRHQSFLALTHIKKSHEIFQKLNVEERIAGCFLIEGLSFIDMGQYSQAEEAFHSALHIAKDIKNKEIERMTLHNLGLFYAEQNHPEAAIRYFNMVLEDKNYEYYVDAIFLITKQYIKLNQLDKAKQWYNVGKMYAEEEGNKEISYKFSLIEKLYLIESKESLSEESFKSIMNYFKDYNQWAVVEDFAERIAEYYTSHQEYENAVHFYSEVSNAKRTKQEMEALK